MKKLIIPIILAGFLFTACKKETKDVSNVVTVSYPTIMLNGAQIISQPIGTGAYTDPGAIGTDDLTGATTSLTPVINDVDLTTPGFYAVKYTTKNSNGYITSSTRLVLVTPVDSTVDLSGTYARTSNGQTVTVTKRGTGLYTTDNVGGVAGSPGYIFDIYFGQVSDTTIEVPPQANPLGGDVYCIGGTLNTNSPITYSYIVKGSGFGTSRRTFVHQ